ncbi:hypothetical protein AB205_0131560 [Aquarana catesbeiana]|uniref:tRNA-guanine(15) transglycosylase-like domain-containing protein n=1 Tax=Aquarana catesbeiana TaxID=8400 RepID=A0A2G9QEM5_AQUCT|nr:hypothetical protein AB205_0131560 [Aquarana catesbeiana]
MTQETKLNLLTSVTAELPEDKPRFIHGVGRPDEILDCVECGVDLFDSSFPYEVAERGSALTFDHQYEPDPETAGGHLSPDRSPESNVLDKAELCDGEKNGEEKTKSEEPEIDQSQITSYEICLKEKRSVLQGRKHGGLAN